MRTVDALDDRGHSRFLGGGNAVSPRVDQGDVDGIGAQAARQRPAIPLARRFVALGPGGIDARLVMAEDQRHAEHTEVIDQAAGPERVNERSKPRAVETADDLQAAELLPADLEVIAQEGDADHEIASADRRALPACVLRAAAKIGS